MQVECIFDVDLAFLLSPYSRATFFINSDNLHEANQTTVDINKQSIIRYTYIEFTGELFINQFTNQFTYPFYL